jgi:hypothetical protein
VSSPYLEDRNLEAMVQGYIDAILTEHSTSRGNNIMLEVGADFTGDNSHTWFKNMDILIEEVNKDPRFRVFYSDPHTYTLARAAETDVKWTVKTDDFFPYSDHEHAFWAGYFTSRPTLKYLERTASALLQNLKQLTASPASAVRALRPEAQRALFQLTAAVGLVNHHDAVTGTSKQHVADDYTKILSRAMATAEALIGRVVTATNHLVSKEVTGLPAFTICRQVNESVCAATQSLQAGDLARVVVYNPLPRTRSQQITVPLNAGSGATVLALRGCEAGKCDADAAQLLVKSDLLENANKVTTSSAEYLLTFNAADVPALGSASYLIRVSDRSSAAADVTQVTPRTKVATEASAPLTISSDKVTVSFDAVTGLMDTITRRDVTDADGSPLSAKVSQDFAYYKSFGSPGTSICNLC